MEPQNPNKRLCRVQNQNPNSPPGFEQNHVDLIISSFLSLPDLPSLSSPLSIGCSFDRVVEKLLEASDDDSVHDRTLQLASLLQDTTKRLSRKHASLHNSNSWLLPHELTIKGLRKLKYLNLSRNSIIKGRFLRDVSHDCKDSLLETLILRDCNSLEEDVSNEAGLIYGGERCSKPK
ncbi:hypothetical protein ARALYDRAFT_911926 [Arabidopsis lyrata subsp. lyrata]|uniref:Uncharacterized protein n=1 Tax=Arabidopsis lyrata subsp. lyrata TaxID=81972 RepID=D7M3D6_ARALL|nr:hypothetical protein ARALYDRAFT_911926 [Arabidopsis lyrata subsp. lyrata]